MASLGLQRARPDSPSKGVEQLFNSVREVLINEGRRYSGRPQRGAGPRSGRLQKHIEDVSQLTRIAERGDPPPVHLLLQCLQRISDLEISASGGDALLWMVPPVLEAARRHLMQDCDERQTLQAEADTFRQRSEIVAMEVEDQKSRSLREKERIEARLRQQRETTKALASQVLALRAQRQEMEATCRQLEVDIGRKTEEGPWGVEQRKLKAEVDKLQTNLNELHQMKAALVEPLEAGEERLANLRQLLERHKPDLLKKDQLRRAQSRLEGEIEDLEKEIEQMREKRTKKRGSLKPRQSTVAPKRKLTAQRMSLLPAVKPPTA